MSMQATNGQSITFALTCALLARDTWGSLRAALLRTAYLLLVCFGYEAFDQVIKAGAQRWIAL